MRYPPDTSRDVRARALFGHRMLALGARAAIVALAFYATLPFVTADTAITGFDTRVSAGHRGARWSSWPAARSPC